MKRLDEFLNYNEIGWLMKESKGTIKSFTYGEFKQ